MQLSQSRECFPRHGCWWIQLLKDSINDCTDKYSGPVQNVCRFLLHIIAAIENERVGVRISPLIKDATDSNPLSLAHSSIQKALFCMDAWHDSICWEIINSSPLQRASPFVFTQDCMPDVFIGSYREISIFHACFYHLLCNVHTCNPTNTNERAKH